MTLSLLLILVVMDTISSARLKNRSYYLGFDQQRSEKINDQNGGLLHFLGHAI